MRVSIGEVDGDAWEKYCQQLLKLKYDDYQEVPARYCGDLGIEGFTHTGIAFQCYCPEGDPTYDELYEKQRDKVTEDIKKLLKNEAELKRLLGNIIINEWHFLTPRYDNRELIAHCAKKSKEVIASGKSHVSKNFKILIRTEDDFLPERQIYVSAGHGQISPEAIEISEKEVDEWKASNNEYFETLEKKFGKIIFDTDKRNIQAIQMIKDYLLGQNILEQIRKEYPNHYEKIIKLKNAIERKVEMTSAISNNNPGKHLQDTLSDYMNHIIDAQLKESIERSTIMRLGQEAISDWLIRCPLDF